MPLNFFWRHSSITKTKINLSEFFRFSRATRSLSNIMVDRKVVVNPRASAVVITNSPKHVTVHRQGIEKLKDEVVNAIVKKELDIDLFSQHKYHPTAADKDAIDWIFVIDTLNFCFWTPGNDTKWQVCGETGYFGLCAAIKRARSNGIDITNAHFYSKITMDELSDILRSDDNMTVVPLLAERVKCLHEVGTALLTKYDGKFENCLNEADHSARRLLRIVTDEFPCYRDEAEWNGVGVSLYKRAQILIGDLWACYRGEGHGYFDDLYYITMFADYRVPQVLVHFGAMTYDGHLMKLLKEDKIFDIGAAEEVEIRGASIFVVEELKKLVLDELKNSHPDVSVTHVNSILLDHFLWDYRRRHAKALEYIPFHKTVGIYY